MFVLHICYAVIPVFRPQDKAKYSMLQTNRRYRHHLSGCVLRWRLLRGRGELLKFSRLPLQYDLKMTASESRIRCQRGSCLQKATPVDNRHSYLQTDATVFLHPLFFLLPEADKTGFSDAAPAAANAAYAAPPRRKRRSVKA